MNICLFVFTVNDRVLGEIIKFMEDTTSKAIKNIYYSTEISLDAVFMNSTSANEYKPWKVICLSEVSYETPTATGDGESEKEWKIDEEKKKEYKI